MLIDWYIVLFYITIYQNCNIVIIVDIVFGNCTLLFFWFYHILKFPKTTELIFISLQ